MINDEIRMAVPSPFPVQYNTFFPVFMVDHKIVTSKTCYPVLHRKTWSSLGSGIACGKKGTDVTPLWRKL